MENLLNFIIRKYLKQEVDDDLSTCMNEVSPRVLYITGNMKIYQCHVIKRQWSYHPQWRSALWTSMNKLFLLPRFDNSSPSHAYELIACYLEAEYPIKPLNEVYLMSKFDVSSFSVTEDIQIFKLVILLTLSSSKLIFILVALGQSKLAQLVSFSWLWTDHSYFTKFRQNARPWKAI